MSIGIYKITNPNGKVYIGQSNNIERRFEEHKNIKFSNQIKLKNSILKYGLENHTFEILEECDMSIIDEREIYWISFLKCVELGLNLTYGGEGGKLSPESELKKRINNSKMSRPSNDSVFSQEMFITVKK
jgi:group I intron endonuclease